MELTGCGAGGCRAGRCRRFLSRGGSWHRQRLIGQHQQRFDVIFAVLIAIPVGEVQRVGHPDVKAVDEPVNAHVRRLVVKLLVLLGDDNVVNCFRLAGHIPVLPDGAVGILDQLHVAVEVVRDFELDASPNFLIVEENCVFGGGDVDSVLAMTQILRVDCERDTRADRVDALKAEKVITTDRLNARKQIHFPDSRTSRRIDICKAVQLSH